MCRASYLARNSRAAKAQHWFFAPIIGIKLWTLSMQLASMQHIVDHVAFAEGTPDPPFARWFMQLAARGIYPGTILAPFWPIVATVLFLSHHNGDGFLHGDNRFTLQHPNSTNAHANQQVGELARSEVEQVHAVVAHLNFKLSNVSKVRPAAGWPAGANLPKATPQNPAKPWSKGLKNPETPKPRQIRNAELDYIPLTAHR